MKSITIIEKTDAFVFVEGQYGAHINNVATESAQLAAANNLPVKFKFNDISLEVMPGENGEVAVNLYESETKRRAQEWRESDAGKQHATNEVECKVKNQAKADALLIDFPDAITSMDRIVAWVGEFSLVSDQGAAYDKADLIRQLEAAGYSRNAYVGDPAVKSEREAFAQWVVGQVLDGLYLGAIHPIASKFAADYVAMFGTTTTHQPGKADMENNSIQFRQDLMDEAVVRANHAGMDVEKYVNELLDMYFRTEERPDGSMWVPKVAK